MHKLWESLHQYLFFVRRFSHLNSLLTKVMFWLYVLRSCSMYEQHFQRQNMLQNFSVAIIIVTFTEETRFCCLSFSTTPTRRLVNFHPQEIRTIETHDKSNRQCKITIIYGIRKSNEDQISNIFDNLATFSTKITQIVV